MNPKNNFLGMLTKSNATSPFSLPSKKKPIQVPAPAASSKIPSSTSQSNAGPTTPTPSPSPAKTAYAESISGSNPYSGIQSGLEGLSKTISGLQGTQGTTPKTDPNAGYKTAMESYINSLNPSTEENDARSRYMSIYGDVENSQNAYAKKIQELGNLGAGAVAGNLSTGTDVVGSGNANLAAQSVSSRLGALGDSQNAYLQGVGLKGNAMNDYLNYLSGDREAKSKGLLARAEFEKSLADQYTPTEIGGRLVRQNPETGAYEEVYSPTETPEPFELSEGQSRYEFDPESGQYVEIASKGKTYAPKDGGGVTPLDGESPFISQPNYGKLGMKQKSQADSLNNLVRTLTEYNDAMDASTGGSGVNLFGADSGLLQTKLNSIIFAAAQAEGTGALQQADREVIEQIIPNPTNVKGAVNTALKGGKAGNKAKIQDQINKYTANLKNYGLTPSVVNTPQSSGNTYQSPSGNTYILPN